MITPDPVMVGSYDYGFVVLSVLISILAAWAAPDLAGRVTAARGRARLAWVVGGAMASGIGTWSMHYTGMLAFELPVPVWYDWPTVTLSLLPAVCATTAALFVVSRRKIGPLRALAAGIFIGAGISGLHYAAMEAMRLHGMRHYSYPLVTLSVILAIVTSLIGLWLMFLFRDEPTGRRLRKAASVLAMGVANPVMHYIGMAATTFTRSAEAPDLAHAVSISLVSVEGITIVPLIQLK
jgi:NO-binding membrane sensor protein with MHYT domain